MIETFRQAEAGKGGIGSEHPENGNGNGHVPLEMLPGATQNLEIHLASPNSSGSRLGSISIEHTVRLIDPFRPGVSIGEQPMSRWHIDSWLKHEPNISPPLDEWGHPLMTFGEEMLGGDF